MQLYNLNDLRIKCIEIKRLQMDNEINPALDCSDGFGSPISEFVSKNLINPSGEILYERSQFSKEDTLTYEGRGSQPDISLGAMLSSDNLTARQSPSQDTVQDV